MRNIWLQAYPCEIVGILYLNSCLWDAAISYLLPLAALLYFLVDILFILFNKPGQKKIEEKEEELVKEKNRDIDGWTEKGIFLGVKTTGTTGFWS